jgi:hypothetical protein
MVPEDLLAKAGVIATPAKDYPVRWTECEDLDIFDDDGVLVFSGPRYFRCSRAECCHLVTHGMIRQGGCWCGNRRLTVAMRLTKVEKEHLQQGYYPLVKWEWDAIEVQMPEGHEPGWGKAEWSKEYA